MPKKALLIVDVQNDFCPGGALPVPEGDKVVAPLNRYIKLFSKKKLPIFASRDWHTKKSKHFQAFGGLWPAHCVQKTKGAEFHPRLKLPKSTIIISKGLNPDEDGYTAFQACDERGNTFTDILEQYGVEEVYIGGLATDYCVRASVLDAIKHKLRVKLLMDAIRGVDLMKGDSKAAIDEMLHSGAKKLTLKQVTSI